MVVFNQTFSEDKPVYFPENWESGKTYIQLYAEWQNTTDYWIYSNLLQIAASSLFLALLFVLTLALKEVRRIHRLEKECLERKRQGRYVRASFVVPLGLLTILCLYYLVVFLVEEWTRTALLKGLVFCVLAYSCHSCYKLAKPLVQKWRRNRARQRVSPATATDNCKS